MHHGSDNKLIIKAGIVVLAVMGVYHAGKIAYRVVKAKEEGQGTKEQIVSGMFSGVVLGPVVELVRREERVDGALSDKEVLKFSNEKMHEIVLIISDMDGEFSESCDHLR